MIKIVTNPTQPLPRPEPYRLLKLKSQLLKKLQNKSEPKTPSKNIKVQFINKVGSQR